METNEKEADMEVMDRVCGMTIEAEHAAATAEHGGETYHFCSEGCWRAFEADPDRYVPADQGDSPGHNSHAGGDHHH